MLLQSVAIGLFSYGAYLPRSTYLYVFSDLSLLGIITLQPTVQPRTKAEGLTRHQLAMFVIGGPVILLGTLAIVVRKLMHDSAHFTSWHGVCMLHLLTKRPV